MRVDPLLASTYVLIADRISLGFLKQASFPNLQEFTFEAPLSFDFRFLESLRKRGYLPVQQWTLVTLDSALNEIGRVVWRQGRVSRLRFPELNNPSAAFLRTTIHMAISGVEEVAVGSSRAASRGTGVGRRDPLPMFGFMASIDGIDAHATNFTITRINAFTLGDNATNELVLTVNPEASADPFRQWLSTGNAPRSGSVRLLNSGLDAFLTVKLFGLRVQGVTPAISVRAPSPAAVRVTYSDIQFEKTG